MNNKESLALARVYARKAGVKLQVGKFQTELKSNPPKDERDFVYLVARNVR